MARSTKPKGWTVGQLAALRKWADGEAHNEKALKVHATVYDNLVRRGALARSSFAMSRITEVGRKALGMP